MSLNMPHMPIPGNAHKCPILASLPLFTCLVLSLLSLGQAHADGENDMIALRDFRALRTPHFDIYFPRAYMEGESREAGRILEGAYREFLEKLGHERGEEKISVFLYESSGAFDRTPIRSSFGKATRLGFSEPLRKRIALWLSPSRRENVYQLRLNLAQVLIFEHLFPDGGIELFLRYVYAEWLITGLALYLAGEYDPLERVALKDAVLTGRLRPLSELKGFEHLNPHEMYESYRYLIEVFRFLEKDYGTERLRQLWREMPVGTDLSPTDRLLIGVYGFGEDELHRQVSRRLREMWQNGGKTPPGRWAEPVTEYQSYYRHFDFGPCASPDGRFVAFLSDRDDVVQLYLIEDGSLDKVIEFGHGWTIDSLEGMETPPSCDGESVLVKAHRGYRTCLFMVGTGALSANRPLNDLDFDDYAGFCFAPGGKSLAFIGVRGGVSELYRYDLAGGALSRLTSDRMAKFQPCFSHDGSKIAYAGEIDMQRDLFVLDLTTGQTEHLARPTSDEAFPNFTPEGDLIFTVSQGNAINLCRYSAREQSWRQLTDVPGALWTPSLSGKWVYFAYYENGCMRLYRATLDELEPRPLDGEGVAPTVPAAISEEISAKWVVEEYSSGVSTDFAFPYLVMNAFRFTDIGSVHNFQSHFGLFSAAVFDPGRRSGGRKLEVSLGVSGNFTYTFADFFVLTLFGNSDYVEPDSHHEDRDRSLDYQVGGSASLQVELTPRLSLDFGYTLFHRKQFRDHPENIRHHYWTGGVFLQMELDQTNRRGIHRTGGYQAEIEIAVYDEVFGSDYNFKTLSGDFRYYLSIYEDHILLLEVKADIAHEDVPFLYDLSGRDNLRGISADEFEGTERWVATAEYRFPIYRDWNLPLLGLVKDVRAFVFVEMGSASTDTIVRFSDLDDVDIRYTAGAGIRIDYYLFQHLAIPLVVQVGKRLDEDDPAIFYLGVSR